jgi:hypothetical protein
MVKTWLCTRVAAVCCVAAGTVAGVAGVPAAWGQTSATGAVFVPAGPVRVMDTRNGTGVPEAPVGPGGTVSLQVAGVAGVPASGASAVVLNVTATGPTAASSVTIYPDGETRPLASNLNFSAGETIPNLVVVPVGTDGKVDFYNDDGTVNLVADLEGYYTDSGSGSVLDSLGPERVMDTRNGTGVPKAPVGPGGTVSLQVSGVAGVPSSGVTAVVLNVTATGPTAASNVTVYPAGETRPLASNLNFSAGETIPNLVVVPVGAGGKVDFYNDAGRVNLVADLAGYYTAAGAGFAPLGPVRIMDTRNGTGVPLAPVGPGGTVSLQVAGVAGVPMSGVTAVVLNVTATGPTAASNVTVYPDGVSRPLASNLNFSAGETIPNLVVVPVGGDGKVDFYNDDGSVNLTADLAGYYTAGTSWGNAILVPGTAALNTGGNASVGSLSCPSAGNCTAIGTYADSSGASQPYVADQTNGTWGAAIQVPGIAAFNQEYSFGNAVSCASAGNCVAGGQYRNASGNAQAFVADEVDGVWGDAMAVPGLANLNTGGDADVGSVSCPSVGNCAATGSYNDSSNHSQAFVASEVDGSWGDAIEIPGTAALNVGGSAGGSVSCASAGNCAIGGVYEDASRDIHAFLADEVDGTWSDAIQVPGLAALDTGDESQVESVSCPSAGNCSAGGSYSTSFGVFQAFVVSEVDGSWGDAIEVPDTAALNTGGYARVNSVSCPSAGNCSAGGAVTASAPGGGISQPFVVSEVNGIWSHAILVPGIPLGAPDAGFAATLVSCGSAGNCVAGGLYGQDIAQVFVVSEVDGTWGDAIQIPGTPNFLAEVNSVSCPPSGACVVGGVYRDESSGPNEAFVVSQN